MGSEGTKGDPAGIPTTSDGQEHYGLTPAVPTKEKKTVEELAAMIRQDLSKSVYWLGGMVLFGLGALIDTQDFSGVRPKAKDDYGDVRVSQ